MKEKDNHFEDTTHAEAFGGGFGDPPVKEEPKKKEAPAAKPADEPNP